MNVPVPRDTAFAHAAARAQTKTTSPVSGWSSRGEYDAVASSAT